MTKLVRMDRNVDRVNPCHGNVCRVLPGTPRTGRSYAAMNAIAIAAGSRNMSAGCSTSTRT
jgi:hypothetical protein